MIPIKDFRKSKRTPVVNVGFIVIAVGVFIYQLTLSGRELEEFLARFAFVAGPFFENPLSRLHTLVTATFLHGGLLHLGGNMLFLFIFGDNLEDALGHLGYAVFYLAAGTIAAVAQGVVIGEQAAPLIGASGAISAVMGGYMILYPGSRVLTLIPLGIFLLPARLPAFIFLGVWAAMQFLYSWQSAAGRLASNVGYLAHLGGFLFGVIVCLVGKKHHHERFRSERSMLYEDRRS